MTDATTPLRYQCPACGARYCGYNAAAGCCGTLAPPEAIHD